MTKKIMGASGRFDCTNGELNDQLDNNFNVHNVDVSAHTEAASSRLRGVFETYATDNSLHLLHFPGDDGRDECVLLSQTPFTDRMDKRLTTLRISRGTMVHIWMTAGFVTGIGWVGVVHTPAHTGGLIPGLQHTAAYHDMLAGMRAARQAMLTGGHCSWHCDWNLDVELPKWRALLTGPYPNMRFLMPDDPTLGNRKVDALLTTHTGSAHTLTSMPGFDHKRVLNTID